MKRFITRKRTGLILTVAAAALMVGAAPSVSQADVRNDRSRNQGRIESRNDRNDRRGDNRTSNDRRWDHRDRDGSDRNRNDWSRFGLSFFFGRPAPVYVAPPPVVYPSPVIISRPSPARVWVPDRWIEEAVPAVYETRYDNFGRPYSVMIQAGYTRRVFVAGHFEDANNCDGGASGGAHALASYITPGNTAPTVGASIHIGGRY